MTAPRQVVVGRTYLVTRRCTQRQFLLKPERRVEQIFVYCLGEAAERFGVTLFGWVAMSNHAHVLLRDNRGNFPEFLAHFHKMVAKAMNRLHGRWENFWAAEQPNAVWLVDPSDGFEKLAYLLANPVKAHLVDRVSDWPGACSLTQHVSGASRHVSRPTTFFKKEGVMPAEVTLRAERLAGYEHLSHSEWSRKILDAVQRAEERARRERISRGIGVVGRKGVLRTQPFESPSSATRRRALRPTIACKNEERRVWELAALRDFRLAYRLARRRWCDGDRTAAFPHGTYRLLAFGVSCVAAPPS